MSAVRGWCKIYLKTNMSLLLSTCQKKRKMQKQGEEKRLQYHQYVVLWYIMQVLWYLITYDIEIFKDMEKINMTSIKYIN
jgi:hypothetical protein